MSLKGVQSRNDGLEVKKSSELGFNFKKDNLFYASICPDCGQKTWKSHKYYIGKRCNDCAKIYSSNRLSKCIGEKNSRWVMKNRISKSGYVLVALPSNSPYREMSTSGRHFIFEHRLVMAQYLGRCLYQWEIVHHKNGIKTDNRIENLELLPEAGKHNTMVETYIKRLENKVIKLEERIRLLEWHIKDIRHGNAVLSGDKSPKCVETIYPASNLDGDIVHSSMKVDG